MSRQRITPYSSAKSFEAYMNFARGLNSEVASESLADNEFPVFENIDLGVRSSARKRMGRTELYTISGGNSQGMGYFFNQSNVIPDVIYANNGKLYVSIDGSQTPFELPIYKSDGTTLTFQTSKPISMAQYYKRMYLATGTDLCQIGYASTTDIPDFATSTAISYGTYIKNDGKVYRCTKAGTTSTAPTHTSGTTGLFTFISVLTNGYFASVVPNHFPDSVEFSTIGTNALAGASHATAIRFSNEIGLINSIVAIYPGSGEVIVNEEVTFTAYVTYKGTTSNNLADLRYKWEYKPSSSDTWTVLTDYIASPPSGATANRTQIFKFTKEGSYDIRCSVRAATVTSDTPNIFYLPDFFVRKLPSATKTPNTIRQATKIAVYENRLLLAGDSDDPYNLYVSQLDNPEYFPYTYQAPFDRVRREPITAIVRYRDYIVVFTKTTVSSFSGDSPANFRVALIHEGIGCVAPRSAQVVGNNIFFLSQEGIHQLRPNPYIQETFNVSRVDSAIKSAVYPDTDACGMVYDSQYFICFPSRNYMYRFYFEQGAWVKDTSNALKAIDMNYYTSVVREYASDGKVYVHNDRIYEKTEFWQTNQAYTSGTLVINKTNYTVYKATTNGTSGTEPPTHTSGTATEGTVSWKFIAQLYADGSHPYSLVVQSKYLDLSMSFNYKKLKKLYVLARHFSTDVNLSVKVEADSAIVLTPDSSEAIIQSNGQVVWNVSTTPNMSFYAGTVIGTWVLNSDPLGSVEVSVQRASISGKARRVRIMFSHSQKFPCEIYGFGLEFKEKKV